ncbi:hypothetical protein DH2020_044379 [Rehmannia glutinosa]|uniref:Glycosyltransferase n=1 Tax=Rehmannia glutinosa TaxID=99300 RepID=A0ABR0UH26_REHGL
MSNLATFINKHHPSISVVLISTAAEGGGGATAPSVTYHRLPTPNLPQNSTSDLLELNFEIPRLNNPNLRQALEEISQKSKIKALIIHFFCNSAFEVSTSLNIPTYFCHTTGAFPLCVLLYWPNIHEKFPGNLNDVVVEIPGCPPIRSVDLPEIMIFRQRNFYKHLVCTAMNMRKSDGLIVNTFYALEFRAMEALANGLCVPDGTTPPVYSLGPLIGEKNGGAEHECLRWLDLQPSKSVVFLCFGRRGVFPVKQLKEMAIGLENSGYRFLWAVRNPPENRSSEKPDLEALLPEGFLERNRERGFVLKSWAPQTEVLSHESVGGFVTHCGQCSVLEAVSFGVPMIGWPLYAEQRMNRVFMVEEMKVAVAVEEAEDGFVKAAELEKRIRELMESETGREIRRRVTELKCSAAAAVREGGSSVVALEKFVETVSL